ncbi:MAG: hypothetical protein MUC96_14795 [Myxococcaceae bacterium]|jgi:hypothetical protein|nr:hypothetical protein [Myxococcaceae bacterium]
MGALVGVLLSLATSATPARWSDGPRSLERDTRKVLVRASPRREHHHRAVVRPTFRRWGRSTRR